MWVRYILNLDLKVLVENALLLFNFINFQPIFMPQAEIYSHLTAQFLCPSSTSRHDCYPRVMAAIDE
jgi:hypothetical protein